MTHSAEDTDGRRLRREKNRAAVIDALITLLDDGTYQPSASQIAARAGVSPRSLFRYFDDIDDLIQAATDQQTQLALPLLDLGIEPSEPTRAKIECLVRARIMTYEQVAPAARALRVVATRRQPAASALQRHRAFLANQLRELFAPEAATYGEATLATLGVLCSFESYDLLRVVHGMSRAEASDALISAVGALLAVHAQPGAGTTYVAPGQEVH